MIDVHGWQILYLFLGDTELDSFIHPRYGADRDSHFLTIPEVPLLEKNMRDEMIIRVDHQPLDAPDISVRSMDLLTATHCHLAQGNLVIDDSLRAVSCAEALARA